MCIRMQIISASLRVIFFFFEDFKMHQMLTLPALFCKMICLFEVQD